MNRTLSILDCIYSYVKRVTDVKKIVLKKKNKERFCCPYCFKRHGCESSKNVHQKLCANKRKLIMMVIKKLKLKEKL